MNIIDLHSLCISYMDPESGQSVGVVYFVPCSFSEKSNIYIYLGLLEVSDQIGPTFISALIVDTFKALNIA